MVSVKVRIIIPFNDGQEKGDIRYMEKKGAIKYEADGVVEILDQKKVTSKTKENKSLKKDKIQLKDNPKNDNSSALQQIIRRHWETNGDSFLEVFAGDDRKSGKPPISNFFNLSITKEDKIQKECNKVNIGGYGVFLNINPLTKPKRIKSNVKKILYAFIDLDDAVEEHNILIKDFLKSKGITYSYNAKSGQGYHFLVPVDLDSIHEAKIKGFLNYLKENCTNKVDLATADLGRLMRFPNSNHNKSDKEIALKTLHNHMPTAEEIKINSDLLLEYQLEQKKGVKDLHYTNTIQREDMFFCTVLSSYSKYPQYYKMLDSSKDRNGNFIKNLGIFIKNNLSYESDAITFLDGWEKSRNKALGGWIKKAKDNNYSVNYAELFKWAKDNNLEEWTDLLSIQLKESFLDRYEFYYLEDEKKENAYLMYYPDKNYYVCKAFNDILTNIYYDCIESGIDLEAELNAEGLMDGYEDKSFKDRMNILKGLINSKIHQEKRIKLVFNINYEPTDEKFIYMDNKKFFNTYNKTELWDYNKKDSKFQFKHIKELIMNLCGNDELSYNYFNNWLGWIIKNPTEKLPTAIIFQGMQGSGKGTLKNLVLDRIFGNNCQEINQTQLESSFNEYLMGKQIIMANEVMHNENRQTLPNVLKNLVTDEYITISRKFRKEIVARNYTHWIFCTNNDNPLKIDEDDRRYNVFYSKKLRKGFGTEIRINLDYELKEYISYLKSLVIDFTDVSEPIMTEAKKEVIELNKDSVEKFRESLQQYDSILTAYIDIFGHDSYFKIFNNFGDGHRYVSTENFFLLYQQYCDKMKERGKFNKQNFSKKLSNKGIITIVKRKEKTDGTFRTYDLDLIEQWVCIE